MKPFLVRLGRFTLACTLALCGTWAVLAIHWSNLPWAWLRTAAAIGFAIGAIAAFARVRPLRRAVAGFIVAWLAVLVWWGTIRASNDRDWQMPVSVAATADIDGDTVTVRGVRDFRYRAPDDFDAVWDDRTYSLRELETVDLFVSYWDGNTAIAHTLVLNPA